MALKVRMKTGEKEGTKLFFSPIYFLCCEFWPFSKNYLGKSILCHKFSVFWGNFFVKTPKFYFIILNSNIRHGA
jgi:hypothetical protein